VPGVSAAQLDKNLTVGNGLIRVQLLNLFLNDTAKSSKLFFIIQPLKIGKLFSIHI
jgi:hypothetical protein